MILSHSYFIYLYPESIQITIKRRGMKKSILLLFCLVCIVSCAERENLFDRSKVEEESKENFPVQDVDPDHDWNMAAVGNLKVSINRGSGEVYTVKVYTANPLNSQSGARLMAKQENVKDGTTLSLTFDMPKATAYVYVLFEDRIYNRSVKMADMSAAAPQISWETSGRSPRSVNALSRSVIAYTAPTDADFFNDIPADAQPYPTTLTNDTLNGNYYLDHDLNNLHGGTKGAYNLFIKGTVSLGSKGWPAGTKVYVLSGSTLNMNKDLNLSGAKTALYIAKDATLNASTIKGTGAIYNRGNVNAIKDIELNNTGYFYNEGTVISAGDMKVTDEGLLVNLSVFNVSGSNIYFSSNGKFLNESGATLNAKGKVSLSDNATVIENSGIFKSAELAAVNGIIYNRCNMTITGGALFNGSAFEQEGGTYFEAGNLTMSGTNIKLGSEAMFYVKSGISYSATNTIVGVGDKAALLWVDAVCQCGWMAITYSGNLKVAVKGHNPENTQYATYYILKDAAEIIGIEQVKLGTANGCGNSYTTDNGGASPEPDTSLVYTYAFEDITTEPGDYDFNDVVLKVSTIPVNGKMEVKLVAAGAIKDLKVFYGNTPLFDNQEVHAAMGCESGQMINTGGVKGNIATDYSIPWPGDGTLGEANFKILDVKNNMYVHLPKYSTASVPYAIVVPKDWDYPGERQRVDSKYPQFTDWAEDMTQEQSWYD